MEGLFFFKTTFSIYYQYIPIIGLHPLFFPMNWWVQVALLKQRRCLALKTWMSAKCLLKMKSYDSHLWIWVDIFVICVVGWVDKNKLITGHCF